MTEKRIQADFGLIASTIPLPIILTWKHSLKEVMKKVIPKVIIKQTPTSKKAEMVVIVKLAEADV